MSVLDDVIEVRGAPAKTAGLLVMGVLMTAASAAMAYTEAGTGSFRQFIGWFGALFFGAATAVIVWRLFRWGVVVLRLDRSGLLDRRVLRQPVPWSVIERVGTWEAYGQRVIILGVPPEVERAIGLVAVARMSRGANAGLEADGLAIATTGLAIAHEALLAAIIARAEAARLEAAESAAAADR